MRLLDVPARTTLRLVGYGLGCVITALLALAFLAGGVYGVATADGWYDVAIRAAGALVGAGIFGASSAAMADDFEIVRRTPHERHPWSH